MRLFAAAISTETNTFSFLPTSLNAYKEGVFLRPGENRPVWSSEPLWVARRRAAAAGFTLIEGSCFGAEPAGTTNRRDYEFMRDEILGQVEAALPLDGVLLGMHGATVAHGYDDVEGDIVEPVRTLVGPKCVIGVELDPHCHLTVKRVKLADVIILFKEYPYTDGLERAEELIDIVLKRIRGQVNPVMSLYNCRQIAIYPTTLPLMRGFVDRVKAMEGKDGILSISICHGFSLGDVPEMGSRILVAMDNDKAKRRARHEDRQGVRLHARQDRPAIRNDQWRDRCRPGLRRRSGSDGRTIRQRRRRRTFGQRRLVDRGIESVALGPIFDPFAVRICFDAGEGARLPLRFGGKIASTSGTQVDAMVTVVGLMRDCRQSYGKKEGQLGDCAGVRVDGVHAVLTTVRTQALGPELFCNVGIERLVGR